MFDKQGVSLKANPKKTGTVAPADHHAASAAQTSVVSHLLGHVQKLVQVHTSVGELPEGTLLLDLGIRLKERDITPYQYVASTVCTLWHKCLNNK